MSDPVGKPERPKPDPKALTPEYHKARKQLMLWAAILFIWELVGIDLEKAKEVGGNPGAIITAIKSPQAVPWVLLILIGYFLFKTNIEWYQCSAPRRALRVSIIDFSSAWAVSLAAVFLYTIQAISKIQLADRLEFFSFPRLLLISFVGASAFLNMVLGFSAAWKLRDLEDLQDKFFWVQAVIGVVNLVLLMLSPWHHFHLGVLAIPALIGLIVFAWFCRKMLSA
jgi:hypothetical protein